jgi:hypothetical protein
MLPSKQEYTVLDVTHSVKHHSEEVHHPGQAVARVDTVDPPRPIVVQLTFYDAHKLKRFSFHDTWVYLEILRVLSSFKRCYLSAAFAPVGTRIRATRFSPCSYQLNELLCWRREEHETQCAIKVIQRGL